MDGGSPPGLLPPFRVTNDYLGALWVSDYSPVGGRVSLFIQKCQVITCFQISVQSIFLGVLRKTTVTLKDPKKKKERIKRSFNSRRYTGFIFQGRDRSDKRFSEFVFIPNLYDPQEIGICVSS